MRCDRCDQPMERKEAVPYTIPGATGPGVTILVHRVVCDIPRSRPRSYPAR
ncbi:hypothetical protein ACIOEW_24885 [Streptomyces sp. NPDC087901]|uniref:hypothetical protein n=1 Tax=unclassified Streptomyces TaxID=2593676 RepID=UPI003428BEF5